MKKYDNVVGYHINRNKDHGRSGYVTYCENCTFSNFDDDTIENHAMAIFKHSESDCIQMCEWCGTLLDHQLTGDCPDCQYDSRTSMWIEYSGPNKGWIVGITIYRDYNSYKTTRTYENVTAASLRRVMTYMFDRGMHGSVQYGSLMRDGIYYIIRGWERK